MSEYTVRINGIPSRLTINEIACMYRKLQALTPPVKYQLTMTMNTYRMLWHTRTPMQRKLARGFGSTKRPTPRHNVRRY